MTRPLERVYLDYNASAPCRREAAAELLRVTTDLDGNPSSLHAEGIRARRQVEQARRRVAASLGARPDEIFFTSGGTESDNLALFGTVLGSARGKPHVVTSTIEHPAVLEACRALEARGLATITRVKCDSSARINPADIQSALRRDTVLVSVMHANNEVGTVQPIRRIARLVREQGALLHCDAVQSVGRIPVNVGELGVDLLSISSHKIGGPKGVGALYVRTGVRLAALLVGGSHEKGLRAGTENVAGICAFAVALARACRQQPAEARRLAGFKNRLWKSLADLDGIHLNGHRTMSLPNTLNLSFAGLSGEQLMSRLDQEGIAVSTGSACAVGAGKDSHVIAAMHLDAARGCGPLRISMGYRTTSADVQRCSRAIRKAVAALRRSGTCCCCAR